MPRIVDGIEGGEKPRKVDRVGEDLGFQKTLISKHRKGGKVLQKGKRVFR